ncbi:MAG: DUF3667 domain-containing protein [Cytophagales bacterium]|jgi:hypothetical protein|nr:DUF3667 domain-containing protein [Cytophagales bacterium]MCA6367024.1 DUF3667 domain-containing protein [Cytophagales bacterium]MCA6374095.1 DUF3667 domain-containing protein [Cytophagales bacterium]MCA6375469.1 DUF3667 domain-containing protein [Cytophagales bacterium]MCA6382136.1 DUF3667 domain-containing protein [Cytophagales bacterium]
MAFSVFKKRQDSFDYSVSRSCKNCGNQFKGKFCNHCGEKVIDVSDRSFVKIAESVLNAFTFLEGKFWRSFKLILLDPGKLTSEIRSGIQVPYMKLVGLFFVANFFYFLFPVFDTFNSSLYSQMNQQSYSEIVHALVTDYIGSNNIAFDQFAKEYNTHSGNLAKLLLIFLVLLFSGIISIVNYSKKSFYFDHLQMSFEFHAFQLLLCSVILPNVLVWVIRLSSATMGVDWSILLSDGFYSWVTLLILFYFWLRAQRTYYQHGWIVSILKAGVLAYLVFEVWSIYRMFLFFATFYTL